MPNISPPVSNLAHRLRPIMQLPVDETPNMLDKNDIYYATDRHRVGPLLIANEQYWCNLDDDYVSLTEIELEDIRRENLVRFLHQKSVWILISRILNQEKIDFWGLKGEGIADEFYDNPATRWAKDVDILVAPKDINGAIQLLLDNGFVVQDSANRKLSLLQKLQCWFAKDIKMYHPKTNQQIELHQRLFYYEVGDLSNFVYRNSPVKKFISASSEAGMFYAILHGALSYWARMKWLADMSLIMRQIDLDRLEVLIEISDKYKCRHTMIASLYWNEMVFPNSLEPVVFAAVKTEYSSNRKSRRLVENFANMLNDEGDKKNRNIWLRPDFPSAAWHVFNSYRIKAALIFYIPMAFILRKM